MKNSKRALRRHHRQRMIIRTLKMGRFARMPEEDRLRQALRTYKNRQNCSCSMCGHRRKWWGPTTQERRRFYAEALDFRNAFYDYATNFDNPIEIVSEKQV